MKHRFLAFLLLALVATRAHAAFTINLLGGTVSDSFGTPLSSSSGVLALVASTTPGDSFFTQHIAGSSLTTNSFLGGDDLVVATFSSFDDGFFSFSDSLSYESFTSQLSANDSLALYWFPTLSAGDTILQGTSYGMFTDLTWAMPADGGTVTYTFATESLGGSLPDSAGFATLTAVPEPATTVALLGAAAGAFVLWRRNRRQAIATTPAAS